MSRPIVILGAGVAGLSAAHHLVRRGLGSKVLVIEQHDRTGGLARSGWVRLADGTVAPTEYSWRIVGSGYNVMRSLLEEVPVPEGGNLLNRLVPICDYWVVDDGKVKRYKSLFSMFAFASGISWFEKVRLVAKITSALIQGADQFRNVTWANFISYPGLSYAARQMAISSIGAYLGLDPLYASASSVLEILQSNLESVVVAGVGAGSRSGASEVFDGPTSERCFDPWQNFLQDHGVVFCLQTQVTRLFFTPAHDHHSMGKINSVEVKRLCDRKSFILQGNAFISCLPVHNLAQLLQETGLIAHMPSVLSVLPTLSQIMRQDIVAVQIFFKEKLLWLSDSKARPILSFPQTPWQLLILPEAYMWKCQDPHFDLWSVGLGNVHQPGWLIPKPWIHCSREEVALETWFQITHTPGIEHLAYGSLTGLGWPQCVEAILWSGYENVFTNSTSKEEKQVETKEPKTSPNAGSWHLRPPGPFSGIEGLWLAGDYVHNQGLEITRMEAAARSGILAVDSLLHCSHIRAFSTC